MRGPGVVAVVVLVGLASPLAAQSDRWPATVDTIALSQLSGEWFEVASTGRWTHRRCLADTRFEWTMVGPETARVTSTCATASGVERRTGRLRGTSRTHAGRWSGSFVPRFFSWLPAAWDDYWLLATGPDGDWLLWGDRYRRRLSLLSRRATVDEADRAAAIGAARALGYDVGQLVPVPQRIDGRHPDHGSPSVMP